MNANSPKWHDIISVVEKANLQATKSLKEQQRALTKKYAEHANQQLTRNRAEINNKKYQEIQERLRMEQDVINQANLQKITKEMKLIKQKQYNKNNYEIVQGHKKTTRKEQSIFLEHPFTRLNDGEEKRKQKYRQNLLKQNQVNKIQQRIKMKEIDDRKSADKQQQQKYSNYIEAYYQRKNQQRNIFKRKYLQISNPQKMQLLPVSNLSNSIEKQYETLNSEITRRAYQSNREKDQMDNVMYDINKKIEIPDSSPAFLGRIPANSDRKKQLEYLQKSINRNEQAKRIKTQGDHQLMTMSRKRYTKQVPQFHALEQYYNKMKTQENTQTDRPKADSSHLKRNTVNDLRNNSVNDKPQKINPTTIHKQKIESTKKVYSTYDIIQNQKKYVFI